MTGFRWVKRPILVSLMLVIAAPALGQSVPDKAVDIRLRKLEAEVSALQRQVFPGGDGKYFPPQVEPATVVAVPAGTPASTPVADMLARMDSLESQVQRLTAQQEEYANTLRGLEARIVALEPASKPEVAAAVVPAASSSVTPALPAPVPPSGGNVSVAPKPAASPAVKPAVKPSAPSAQRLAAVQKIEKPQSNDSGEDEYAYGYRLWEAKFYPEAQQQLKLFVQKYPKHKRASYARNLLGRSYLDDGNPHEAASWFLQNYQANKAGDRAADSLLNLAEAMRQLKDTNRACVALAQFGEDYPKEAAGRLKASFETIRAGVKCN